MPGVREFRKPTATCAAIRFPNRLSSFPLPPERRSRRPSAVSCRSGVRNAGSFPSPVPNVGRGPCASASRPKCWRGGRLPRTRIFALASLTSGLFGVPEFSRGPYPVFRLPRGVTVAQVTLDHFVMVRIHARQIVRSEALAQDLSKKLESAVAKL